MFNRKTKVSQVADGNPDQKITSEKSFGNFEISASTFSVQMVD